MRYFMTSEFSGKFGTMVNELKENLMESVAGKLGLPAGVSKVFGEPIERQGVTIIPVSQIIWGFGGGSVPVTNARSDDTGDKPTAKLENIGGGGGIIASPLGYIEIKDGKTIYRPVFNLNTMLLTIFGFSYYIVKAVLKSKKIKDLPQQKQQKLLEKHKH
jgi:uncharacterized spore protein YtfJ